MKLLSLKLKEEILAQTDEVRKHFDISRNAYINDALKYYNKKQKREWVTRQLKKESELLHENSFAVMKDINLIDHGY